MFKIFPRYWTILHNISLVSSFTQADLTLSRDFRLRKSSMGDSQSTKYPANSTRVDKLITDQQKEHQKVIVKQYMNFYYINRLVWGQLTRKYNESEKNIEIVHSLQASFLFFNWTKKIKWFLFNRKVEKIIFW